MRETRETDAQFEVSTIEEVTRRGEYWDFRSNEGWSFGFTVSDAPGFTPKVGDEVRTYGKGFGYSVRGLTIAGQVIFYRTEEQERAKFEAEMAERKAKRLREYEETGRAVLDAKYAALPPVFQARIDRFRENNPDFRVEYEGYEMFCCEEAVKLATHLGTPGAMAHYTSLAKHDTFSADRERWQREWEEQKAIDRAAGISDDHSGNTHGAMIALAHLYVNHPDYVAKMHGALSPLVGSAAYGDIPVGAA